MRISNFGDMTLVSSEVERALKESFFNRNLPFANDDDTICADVDRNVDGDVEAKWDFSGQFSKDTPVITVGSLKEWFESL